MAIRQIIRSRDRDLGGFVVRRVLPFGGGRMVGPFIFFDHLGPAQFAPGTGIDVRPHPHVALATVTYLFAGSMQHRDSLGNVVDIRPGDVNWMTAGSGITHSERTSAEARAAGFSIHGIQSWVALPDGYEEIDPAFTHHPAGDLPRAALDGLRMTVIAGTAFGRTSPVATHWPTLYVDAEVADDARVTVDVDYEERAVYVVRGAVDIDGTRVAAGELALLEAGAFALRAEPAASADAPDDAASAARVMLLGGAKFPRPRHLWWNFVGSSTQLIERAKARWAAGEFPAVPGEHEFIPLPAD